VYHLGQQDAYANSHFPFRSAKSMPMMVHFEKMFQQVVGKYTIGKFLLLKENKIIFGNLQSLWKMKAHLNLRK
jgi:hypothetical protein